MRYLPGRGGNEIYMINGSELRKGNFIYFALAGEELKIEL
jgi:hypothetical protein